MGDLARALLNVLRGFLIGSAELVPGVSGGTVALVSGVYDQLVDSASHGVDAVVRLVRGPHRSDRARQAVGRVDVGVVLPVLLGMGLALVTIAGTMEGFVTEHPELARGLFLGLVLASIAVPLRMARAERTGGSDGSSLRDGALLVGPAVLAFVLVGLAGGGSLEDPPLLLVAGVAAVAVCALVVPGVSGSFLLLAVGLYSTTLGAVAARDLTYVVAFALGAVVGLGTFVRLLRWLLERHRGTTLLVMAGLMTGSLRALWPWQSGQGAATGTGPVVAPYDPVAGPVLLALLGVAVVAAVTGWQSRQQSRQQSGQQSGAGRGTS